MNNREFWIPLHRYLADSQSVEGKANVISAFPFEDDKYKALSVLQTVCIRNIGSLLHLSLVEVILVYYLYFMACSSFELRNCNNSLSLLFRYVLMFRIMWLQEVIKVMQLLVACILRVALWCHISMAVLKSSENRCLYVLSQTNTDRHVYRQTDMCTDWQTRLETERHVFRHVYRQTDMCTDWQTCLQTDRHVYRLTDMSRDWKTCLQTRLQTDRHVYRLTDMSRDWDTSTDWQTCLQTARHVYRLTDISTDRLTDMSTDRQTCLQTARHVYRLTDMSTDRQTRLQTDRHVNRLTDMSTDSQTRLQADRHVYRQTDRHVYRLTDMSTDW